MTRKFGGERGHAIAGVFVFLLLGVFAVFSTLLVLFGAQAYRATTARTATHGDERTIYAYMLNSLRGDDEMGMVRPRTEDGIDMVAVSYDFDGDLYEKRIYCYDGYLRELFTSAENEFDPAGGEKVCEAQSLKAQMDGSLLTVEITDANGKTHTVDTAMRTTR